MSQRINQKDLEQIVRVLNRRAGTPDEPYTDCEPNPGAYYVDAAYGAYALFQMMDDGSTGARTIIGRTNRRELYRQISALIDGIEIGRTSTQ